MPKFYTIDRLNYFTTGMTVNAFPRLVLGTTLKGLQQHLDLLFPSGVAPHANNFLNRAMAVTNGQIAAEPMCEIFLEYVRRAEFAACPSRFQVLFACATPQDAIRFRQRCRGGLGGVWEVTTATQPFRGDMNLLLNGKLGGRLLVLGPFGSTLFAHRLQSGSAWPDEGRAYSSRLYPFSAATR